MVREVTLSNLNYKEIGQVIRINIGKDISTSTPSLILQPEVGDEKEFTTGVTVGCVQVTEGDEIFYINEYIEYTTEKDDLDYVGRWRKRAELDFSPTNIEKTDFIKFRVLP